ncbi:MAG: sugar transferase, partial [Streptomyces sp.]
MSARMMALHPVPPARKYTFGDKARWYTPGAMAVDALGTGVPVFLVFTAGGQPHPVWAALLASAAWLGVQAVHQRYTLRLVGESRGLLSTLHDWLTLAGVLAVVQVVSGVYPAPAYALAAIASAPLLTGAYRALTHRDLTARRRVAQAVRRVLVIGEAGPAGQVVEQLAARTDHAYVVIGAMPVGTTPLSGGIPEAGRLDAAGALPTADGAAVLE